MPFLGLGLEKFSAGGLGKGVNTSSFIAPLTSSLTLLRGIGDYDFTRDEVAPAATITDFEGLVKNVQADEARFKGARRVENICSSTNFLPMVTSDTLGSWSRGGGTVDVAYGVVDPDGGTEAVTVTATASNGYIANFVTSPAGSSLLTSCWIRRRTGTGVISIMSGGNYTVITDAVTTEWGRVVSDVQVRVLNNSYITIRLGTDTDAVDICWPQNEEVTGQAIDDAPSEYVSVGVGTEAESFSADSAGGPFTTVADWPAAGTGSRAIVGGKIEVTQLAAWNDGILNTELDETLIPGKLYVAEIEIEIGTATLVQMQIGTGGYANGNYGLVNLSADGIASFVFRADSFGNLGVTGKANAASVWRLVSASVKEVDHGSNVDAVKYYPYHNTLEVVGNVVVGTGGRGAELAIANADCSTDDTSDTGTVGEWTWTTGPDWEVTSGALRTKAAFTQAKYEAATPVIGSFYEVIFDLTNDLVTAAFASVNLNKVAGKINRTIIHATSVIPFSVVSDVGGDAVIDNVSIKQIDVPASFAQGTTFGRQVENLCQSPILNGTYFSSLAGDLYDSDIAESGVVGPSGEATGARFTVASTTVPAHYRRKTGSSTPGDFVSRCAIYLHSALSAGQTISLYTGVGAAVVQVLDNTDAAGVWHILSTLDSPTASGAFGVRMDTGSGESFDVTFADLQYEDVTNQTNQNPGEYVSKGVDVYPYSGTGIDGVAEFPTTNPNQVDVNDVVTADLTTYPVTPGDGVLIEGERTNILLYSDDFTNWNHPAVLVVKNHPDAPIAYPAYGHMDELQADSVAEQITSGNVTITTATEYHAKCQFAASDYSNNWRFRMHTTGGTGELGGLNINMTGVPYIVGVYPSGVTAGSEYLFETEIPGIYECGFSFNSDDNNLVQVEIMPTYSAEANRNIFVGMVQIEVGSFPSSYIPTVGSAVVRGDDELTFDIANFPGNTEGTLLSTITQVADDLINLRIINVTFGASKHLLVLNNMIPRIYDGTNALNDPSGVLVVGEQRKIASSWGPLGLRIVSGGGTIGTSSYTGNFDTLGAQIDIAWGNNWFGSLKDLTFYKKELADAKFQELTKVESD